MLQIPIVLQHCEQLLVFTKSVWDAHEDNDLARYPTDEDGAFSCQNCFQGVLTIVHAAIH